MAGLKFQGDINVLSDKQITFLRKVLEKRGFTDEDVLVESVGKKGDNYVASVKRITVESNNGEPFKMIAKVAPKMEMIRIAMSIETLFLNEITMYSEVLPKFADLLQTEDVPHDQRFRMPTCYGYLSEAPNEIILLEDLQVSNFKMLDRFQPLSNEDIKLVLKDLAIFHSLSYVMQERNNETFQSLKTKLPSMWEILNNSEEMKYMMNILEIDAIDILESERYKKVLQGNVGNFTDTATKLHKHSLESKHSVIQQGDCWTNNIMFRVEESTMLLSDIGYVYFYSGILTGTPKSPRVKPIGERPVTSKKEGKSLESCMIDYQLSRPASPVADILYLILNCTDHETRSKNYNDWLDFYHCELDKSLNNFDLKANRIFSRDQMDADLRRYGKLALALSIVLANALCRESEEVVNIDEMNIENGDLVEQTEAYRVKNMKETTKLRFKKRVEDCINSTVEFGLVTR